MANSKLMVYRYVQCRMTIISLRHLYTQVVFRNIEPNFILEMSATNFSSRLLQFYLLSNRGITERFSSRPTQTCFLLYNVTSREDFILLRLGRNGLYNVAEQFSNPFPKFSRFSLCKNFFIRVSLLHDLFSQHLILNTCCREYYSPKLRNHTPSPGYNWNLSSCPAKKTKKKKTDRQTAKGQFSKVTTNKNIITGLTFCNGVALQHRTA